MSDDEQRQNGGGCNPDADPEAERPQNFQEAVSGDYTWDEYGLRLKWTMPQVPGNFECTVDECLKLRLCVQSRQAIPDIGSAIKAYAWSNIVTRENECGVWKETELMFNPSCTMEADDGVTSYLFHTMIIPTKEGNDYRLTFNIKYGTLMIWADIFQSDNICKVLECPAIVSTKCILPGVKFKCTIPQKRDSSGECKLPEGEDGRQGKSGRSCSRGRDEGSRSRGRNGGQGSCDRGGRNGGDRGSKSCERKCRNGGNGGRSCERSERNGGRSCERSGRNGGPSGNESCERSGRNGKSGDRSRKNSRSCSKGRGQSRSRKYSDEDEDGNELEMLMMF